MYFKFKVFSHKSLYKTAFNYFVCFHLQVQFYFVRCLSQHIHQPSHDPDRDDHRHGRSEIHDEPDDGREIEFLGGVVVVITILMVLVLVLV